MLKSGDKVEVYRNLHKNCFSVRRNGRVVKHLHDDENLVLKNVRFVVQPAGRKKVLDQKRKNVHAFVRGTVAFEQRPIDRLYVPNMQITYNPYKYDKFYYQSHFFGDVLIEKTDWAFIQEGHVFVYLLSLSVC